MLAAPCSSEASIATPALVQSALTVCGLVLRQSGRGTNIGKKERETKTDSSLRDCDQIGLI